MESAVASGKKHRKKRDGRSALLFLTPLLAMYAVYFFYSIYYLIVTSQTKVSISFRNPMEVGFDNFRLLVEDPLFIRSLINNLIFGAVSIVSALTIGFFIAAALASGIRAKKFLYVIFLVPTLMPTSLVATIFGSMLQERYGVVNQVLRALGLDGLAQAWLTDPVLAYGVVMVIFAYLIGLPIMYFTADFSTLPTESLEAALLDGAGTFRIMRQVVYPMMTATRTTIVLSLLLGSFRAMEVVLFSTQGGPRGRTEIVGSYLYGYATSSGQTIGFVSAASVVVLLVAFVIAVVQIVVSRRNGQ